jgi:predicted GNAT family acetyltransferase
MRRQGLGAAVTSCLVEHAFAAGVELVLLSAASDDVAAVYERVGFRRIGHAGGAEPAEPSE